MMAASMESHCIPFTEIPQTPALFADCLYRFSRVKAFFSHDPFDPAAFPAASREISLKEAHRAAVAEVLSEQNRVFGGGRETEENIARLRRGAVAVVTGQQVGLFGGPAYSVYKALTALRLAEKLSAEGLTAVPVFWLAGEDHDFEEVNHCFLLDAGFGWRELRDAAAPPDGTPVGQAAFGSSITALRAQVTGLWPREAAAEAGELLEGYVPGATYSQAFGRLLQRLFAGRGLIVLDPMQPALHTLARPLYRRALEESEKLHALLKERDKQLDKAGYHRQVRLRENSTLLFVIENGRRLPLGRRRNGFLLGGNGEPSLTELLGELDAAPERFSPNVLLRPVVQDWLLPTAAYVAGPHELAYFAQAQVLYRELLGRMPVIYPRASLTVVEPKVRRLLSKYRLSLPDLFHGEAALRLRLAERHLPPRLQRQFQASERKLETLLAEAAREVKKLDPTLAGAAETSRRKMLYQFGKLRGQAARAQAARIEIVERHVALLLNALYPAHGLQERQMNILSVVARHGREVVGRLDKEMCFPCRDHQVIVL